MTTFVLIPARKGSSGIRGKNLKILGGLTLVEIAIESAKAIQNTSEIWVSSDSKRILKVASDVGANVHLRSYSASSAEAKAEAVVQEFILSVSAVPSDIIIYLQPTSPFRGSQHVLQALELRKRRNKPVVSVTKVSQHPTKMLKISPTGLLSPLATDFDPSANRQTLQDIVIPNGAIYIFTVEEYQQLGLIPVSGSVPYFMNAEDSLDIDTNFDLRVARLIVGAGR